MIEEHVRQRLRREYDYQNEKLKNWLRIIYRDPDAAMEKLHAHVLRHGFLKLDAKLRDKPQILGALKGSIWFNFWKSTEYQTSEHRIQDLCAGLRRWEDAYVQMEQIDERIAEAHAAEKQMQDELAARKEERLKAKTRNKEKSHEGPER